MLLCDNCNMCVVFPLGKLPMFYITHILILTTFTIRLREGLNMFRSGKRLFLAVVMGFFLVFFQSPVLADDKEYSSYSMIDIMEYIEETLDKKIDISKLLEPEGFSAIMITAIAGDVKKTDQLLEMNSDITNPGVFIFACGRNTQSQQQSLDKDLEVMKKILARDPLAIRHYIREKIEKALRFAAWHYIEIDQQTSGKIDKEASEIAADAGGNLKVMYDKLDKKVEEIEKGADAKNPHVVRDLKNLRRLIKDEANIFCSKPQEAQVIEELEKAFNWYKSMLQSSNHPEVLRHLLNKADPVITVDIAKETIDWVHNDKDVCKECLSILEEYIKKHGKTIPQQDYQVGNRANPEASDIEKQKTEVKKTDKNVETSVDIKEL